MARPSLPTPPKACQQCGTILQRARMNGRLEDRTTFLRRRYCGRECMALAMQKPTCNSISHSRMKAARAKAKACAHCGAKERLHVHHRDENPRNNEPSNLLTLCASCHKKSHSPNYTDEGRTRKPCEHCSRPSVRRGLCATHLTRLKRHGHPLGTKAGKGLSEHAPEPFGG